jgi:DNA-binding NarL/FixJ family response regulator
LNEGYRETPDKEDVLKPFGQLDPAQPQPISRPIRLTQRELEVLALLCQGLPNKLISRRLEISSATVKCHISRILNELGVSSRLQAVIAASRYGLLNETEAILCRMDEDSTPPRRTARPAIRLVGGTGMMAAS